jgi:hypothetical protein
MKYCLLTLSVFLLFFACKKSSTPTVTTEDMLKTGKWKLASGTLTVKNPNGKDTILTYLDFIPECFKDDYLKFDSLNFGKIYYGGNTCTPGDPEFRSFQWLLSNNGTTIDLYNGFNEIFAVVDTIQPYKFDTLNQSPLELDTVLGALDTLEGQIKQFLVLDTIRELRYSGVPVGDYLSSISMSGFNINKAQITEFSQSSFFLNFAIIGKRLDSTNFHGGPPNNYDPLIKNDTLRYKLKFSNF